MSMSPSQLQGHDDSVVETDLQDVKNDVVEVVQDGVVVVEVVQDGFVVLELNLDDLDILLRDVLSDGVVGDGVIQDVEDVVDAVVDFEGETVVVELWEDEVDEDKSKMAFVSVLG